MKNIKFYWLILLIAFTVSLALPVNAQTKKIRKKSKVTKKKVVRKVARPNGMVKLGTTDYSPPRSGSGSGDGIFTAPVGVSRETISIPSNNAVVNGKAISLPKPPYPAAAKAVRASGVVNIRVLIDEEGNVISANAVSGHPLLRAAAEQAARGAKFSPTLLEGNKVKVSGIITYNFVAQ
jgi:TonB family protein